MHERRHSPPDRPSLGLPLLRSNLPRCACFVSALKRIGSLPVGHRTRRCGGILSSGAGLPARLSFDVGSPGRRGGNVTWSSSRRLLARCLAAPVALACLLVAAGCAGLLAPPLPPRVEGVSVRLQSLESTGVRLSVMLEVGNPNTFAIDLDAIDAIVLVDGVRLATATLPAPVSLPAGTARGVELALRVRFAQLAAVLERAGGASFPYEVTGTAALGDGTRLPFARRGELSLGEWLQERTR